MTPTPAIGLGIIDPVYVKAAVAGLPELGAGVDRTIIVTGPPRTGTSMVAGLLHESGLHMGSRLQGPASHNEKGLFEDEIVVKLNNLLLTMASGSWLIPPPPENFRLLNRDLLIDLARYEQRETWGLKDGRFCLTLPVWEWVLDHCRPRFVICHRNILSAAKSMCLWWGLALHHALKLVAEYELRIAAHLGIRTDWPALHLSYEDFLSNPRTWAGQLAAFTGVDIAEETIEEFVEPALKHF